jgi:hypothetical protein
VDAYAYRNPDFFDATKKATVAILTTVKIDRKVVDGALDRESAIDEQVRSAKGSTIQLTFSAAGDLIGLNAGVRTESGFQSFSTSGSGKAEIKTNTAERIAGRVYTEAPKTFGDDTYSFDLRFDLAIVPEPPPGTPLPAGGGEAGKAYAAYIAVLQKGDIDGIARYWPKEKGAKMLAARKDPDFKESLDMLKLFSPKTVTVKGGMLRGNVADLDVVGKDADGKVMDGKVRMIKDGPNWLVEKEDLTTHMTSSFSQTNSFSDGMSSPWFLTSPSRSVPRGLV